MSQHWSHAPVLNDEVQILRTALRVEQTSSQVRCMSDAAETNKTDLAPLGKKRSSALRAIWWLLLTLCLIITALFLARLDASGVYVYLGPGLNSGTLRVGSLLAAVASYCLGIIGIIRWASPDHMHLLPAILISTSGWIVGAFGTASLLFGTYMALLSGGSTTHPIESANDDRSVLLVHHAVFASGDLTVYVPKRWPIYYQVDRIETDATYNPIKAGAYQTFWTDQGLRLRVATDSSNPDHYEEVFIPRK